MHLTHSQFHSYGGTNWGDFESKAKEVTDYVNSHKNITIDTGNVTLDVNAQIIAHGGGQECGAASYPAGGAGGGNSG